MRWSTTAVLFFISVCSVLSTEVDDGEPYIHIMARSSVYNAGEQKAIFCKGRNLPEELKWYTPSNKLVEPRTTKNPRVYVEKIYNDGMLPLIIQSIKIEDNGNWTCKAGNFSKSIEFIVGEKAFIAERTVKMEGQEGKSITLTCEAKGYPTPVVVWYKADTSPPTPIHEERNKYVIRANNSLQIKNLNHADVATYVCKVRQKALSHYTDKTVHLTVQHKPIMYDQLTHATKYKTEEIYAIMNETKNITCSAIANPAPSYSWFRRFSSDDDQPITDPDMIYTSEDSTFSILMLRIHNESDIGQYMCLAKNIKGQESIVFDVSLGDKPNPPDFVSLYSANSSSLTFNVSCSTCPMELNESVSDNPMNLTIKGFAFQLVPVKKDYIADWDNALTMDMPIEGPNDTLFTLGPLPNTTEFHARVCSINAAGYSEWCSSPQTLRLRATPLLSRSHSPSCSLLAFMPFTKLFHSRG